MDQKITLNREQAQVLKAALQRHLRLCVGMELEELGKTHNDVLMRVAGSRDRLIAAADDYTEAVLRHSMPVNAILAQLDPE